MKKLIGALALVATLGLAQSASANTIWNLTASFDGPGNAQFGTLLHNTAVGTITMDATFSTVLSWDVTVTGTDTTANHHYLSGNAGENATYSSGGPTLTFFVNPGFSPFLSMTLASPLTNAGGTINFTSGFACPGCGVLTSGYITTNSLTATAVPEPATLSLLGLGLVGAVAAVRRRARR